MASSPWHAPEIFRSRRRSYVELWPKPDIHFNLPVSLALVFWNEERYNALIKPAVRQIGYISATGDASAEDALIDLFASLAHSTTSETVLKTVNDAVCMTTRSDVTVERLLALRVLDKMWDQQEELIQFAATTISDFISETLEDADPAVEHAAKKFLDRMRAVLGNEIDNYF